MQLHAADLTYRAVLAQIAAMGADTYDLGVLDPNAVNKKGEIEARMELRTLPSAQVQRLIPYLKARNAGGCHVYVRPAGTHHCLTLLDDLDSQSLAKLVSDGLKPAAVIETSPGNFHAWLRHPARLDPAVNTRLSQTLAARYGSDPGSADWRHFGRLAGFTNRKSAYRSARGQFPFCLLRESSAAIVDLSSDIAEAAASLQAEAEEMAAVARRHAERRASGIAPERASRSIASFHTDPRYGGDLTRADLAYAVYALSRDVSAADVSAALAARDLSHKGGSKRQHEYVARTLEKALSTVVAATA